MSPIKRVDRLHVVSADGVANVFGRLDLPLAARAEEIEHGVILRRVAEIISDNRLQDVIDQVLHRADARDHLRRIERADVDDLRHVEVEGEPVLRTHRDRREFFVVMMRLGARGPVQDDVGRRHQLDLHDARVERMFAGIQRRHPNTFVADVDEIAVLEFHAAHVHVRLARRTK